MNSNRQAIALEILKIIEYGNLSRDEIERRLEQIIDAELNVPLYAEINKEKVDLCNSLLWELYTQGRCDIKFKDNTEDSKKRLIEKLKKDIKSKQLPT